jgi:hypothetical protein
MDCLSFVYLYLYKYKKKTIKGKASFIMDSFKKPLSWLLLCISAGS